MDTARVFKAAERDINADPAARGNVQAHIHPGVAGQVWCAGIVKNILLLASPGNPD